MRGLYNRSQAPKLQLLIISDPQQLHGTLDESYWDALALAMLISNPVLTNLDCHARLAQPRGSRTHQRSSSATLRPASVRTSRRLILSARPPSRCVPRAPSAHLQASQPAAPDRTRHVCPPPHPIPTPDAAPCARSLLTSPLLPLLSTAPGLLPPPPPTARPSPPPGYAAPATARSRQRRSRSSRHASW